MLPQTRRQALAGDPLESDRHPAQQRLFLSVTSIIASVQWFSDKLLNWRVVAQKVDWTGRQSVSACVEEDDAIALPDLALTMKVSCQDILRGAETAGNVSGGSRATRLAVLVNRIDLKIPSDDLAHAARQ